MVESMAATSERIKYYESMYGKETVESFLDAVLAIQEHIDPHRRETFTETDDRPNPKKHPYDDLLFAERDHSTKEKQRNRIKIPPQPEKDILFFIEQHSSILTEWQCDILTTIREEMYYFWPQLETKIMNEGWATYWHQRIIRELSITDKELIEYSKLNASVVQKSTTNLNPYYLGLKMFEYIEHTYNNPTEEMKQNGVQKDSGRNKIFEVRMMDNDTSFIRNYLTSEFVQSEDMFLFEKQNNLYRITDKEFESIRHELIVSRTNGGFPYIVVKDGDYMKNGELYLQHKYEAVELDLEHLEQVLEYIYKLWGKSIHMETIVDKQKTLFSYNGLKHFKRKVYT